MTISSPHRPARTRGLQPSTLRFDSTDLDEVAEHLSTLYSRTDVSEADGRPVRTVISRQPVSADLEFHHLSHASDLSYRAEASDQLIVCDVLGNSIDIDADATSPARSFGPGDQFLLTRPGLRHGGVARASTLRFTVLDADVLADALLGLDVPDGSRVDITDSTPLSRRSQRLLRLCIDSVRENLGAVPPSPLLAAAASQYLAAAVLSAYPSAVRPGPDLRADGDVRRSALTRAVSFIEAHPDVTLTLTDIADAACVTPRALQLAFRRHLDTTPMAYVRQVRLGMAHDDLRAGEPATATVGEIAGRWGFSLSRFSDQYQGAYGETPSTTLRR